MARRQDWQEEVRDALLSEAWSTTGPSRIVKVVSASGPIKNAVHGFICLEKSLLGRTPQELQGLLGLPPKCFDMGCRVYRFLKLPLQHEVEYELTAHYPNGLAFNAAMHDPAYAPGSKSIHQWRLLVDVPVEHLLDLAPGARYPYLHG